MTLRYDPVKNILMTMLLAAVMIFMLIFFAGGFKTNKNGFRRRLERSSIQVINAIKKPSDVIAICAVSGMHIYFQTTTPGKLVITNDLLQGLQYLSIHYSSDEKAAALFYTIIDSPAIYLLAGNNGTVAHANFPDKNFSCFSFKLPVFTRAVLIRPSTFIIRGSDTSSVKPDQIFMKINAATAFVQSEKNLSEKKGDAGIATDGLLHYDSSAHVLIYTFFYNNNFIC